MALLVQEAQLYLKELEERLLQHAPCRMLFQVAASLRCAVDVAQAIIEYSERHLSDEPFMGCGMIAMATHERKGLARWVMESMAECVLTAARQSLLLVRPNSVHQAHDVSHMPKDVRAQVEKRFDI